MKTGKILAAVTAVTVIAIGFATVKPAVAITHDQICLQNRAQCQAGCAGMAQCLNACEINYEGCIQAGH